VLIGDLFLLKKLSKPLSDLHFSLSGVKSNNMTEISANWNSIIKTLIFFIFPFLGTICAFWLYFKLKDLKERGAKVYLHPILWAFIGWGGFAIWFPQLLLWATKFLVEALFILVFNIIIVSFYLSRYYTKWKKEAIKPKVSPRLNQGQRILVIIAFFVVYVLTLILLPFYVDFSKYL